MDDFSVHEMTVILNSMAKIGLNRLSFFEATVDKVSTLAKDHNFKFNFPKSIQDVFLSMV